MKPGALTGLLIAWAVAGAGAAAEAPPAIRQHGVVNAASLMPPLLAGGSIARGSQFRIEGVRFGPIEPARAASSALQQDLAGVSVEVAQGGAVVRAALLEAGESAIVAVLPRNAPLGLAKLTVKFEGQSSAPYDLKIVESSFGIFSADSQGHGPARIERLGGSLIALSGTGLGSGRLELLVGGKRARIRSAGPESCCAGVDRIVFEIPAAVPHGCFVPVLARTGSAVSNTVTIAIGQPCSVPVNWLARESYGPRSGFVLLLRSHMRLDLDRSSPVEFLADLGLASFSFRAVAPETPLPPLGTCATYAGALPIGRLTAAMRGARPEALLLPEGARLNAGAKLTVRGPRGARELPMDTKRPGTYVGLLGGNPPSRRRIEKPPFLDSGDYTIEGEGGPDVGLFRIRAHAEKAIEWIGKRDTTVVDRAKGVAVSWRGVGRDQTVFVAAMNDDSVTAAAGLCLCLIAGDRGHFKIPPAMLANIPATVAVQDLPTSLLLVGALPNSEPERIHATGLDSAPALFLSIDGASVIYK